MVFGANHSQQVLFSWPYDCKRYRIIVLLYNVITFTIIWLWKKYFYLLYFKIIHYNVQNIIDMRDHFNYEHINDT